jgi:hypothetical protein
MGSYTILYNGKRLTRLSKALAKAWTAYFVSMGIDYTIIKGN